jgi:flagellar biosynthesis protein FliQ
VTELFALDLGRQAMWMAVLVSAPMLGVALVVGLVVSVFQALTQVNEATLSFVPKLLGICAALVVAGPWIMSTLLTYTTGLFEMLPQLAR